MSKQTYTLDIDGPLFRQQREWLLSTVTRSSAELEIKEGLINLLDAIADCAHDVHGIDCLLEEKE